MNKGITDKKLSSSSIDYRNYALLFLLWPFVAFITALMNYKQSEAKKVVYLFIIYYGFSYYIGAGGATDSYEYVRRLQINSSLPFSDFFNIVGGLYSSDNSVDIVEPFISFVVSRFTSHPNLLFGSYAALFGFFYLKSCNLLYNRYQEKPGWNRMIFMFFFVLAIPITYVNGFRMWTAAWAFFYGAYYVILYHDKRYLLLTLGASLIHWSFISANVVLLIYYFVGNRNIIYLSIVFVSFILPNVMASTFRKVSLQLGSALQNRYTGYTQEEYVFMQQESWQQASWFLLLSKNLPFYYLIAVIFIIYIFFRDLMKEKVERNLFSFLLLFLAFVNFGKVIPNFGERFQIVFILFATLYIFFYFMKLHSNKLNFLTLVGLFPMALYIAVEFRIGSEGINSWIFTPGFGIPLIVPGLSLASLLFPH